MDETMPKTTKTEKMIRTKDRFSGIYLGCKIISFHHFSAKRYESSISHPMLEEWSNSLG